MRRGDIRQRIHARDGDDEFAFGRTIGKAGQVDGAATAGEDDAEAERAGIGDGDDLIRGVELGIDTFDCAMPTRLGRHGTALVPDPHNRWRVDLTKSVWRTSKEPLMEGCACHACTHGLSRAYLSYLVRSGELTGMRLLTEHNLAFLARLMAELRQAIHDRRLSETAAKLRGE